MYARVYFTRCCHVGTHVIYTHTATSLSVDSQVHWFAFVWINSTVLNNICDARIEGCVYGGTCLYLVVPEFVHYFAGRFSAPRCACATAAPMQIGSPLGRTPLRRWHSAGAQAGRTRWAGRIGQHAVFCFRRAPVHGLKTEINELLISPSVSPRVCFVLLVNWGVVS